MMTKKNKISSIVIQRQSKQPKLYQCCSYKCNGGSSSTKAKKKSKSSLSSRRSSSTSNISTQNKIGNVLVQCWAHSRNGRRCENKVSSREGEPIPVPYCNVHLKYGDGCLKVVNVPNVGKCLVARMAFWGIRGRSQPCSKEDRAIAYFPPDPKSGSNKYQYKYNNGQNNNTNSKKEKIRMDNYNGVLNPTGTGDIIQYAACPGPNERQNMKSTFQYWGRRNGKLGGLEFVTLEEIPKNTQLVHWYGPGWFKSRGLKRMDVGTKRYPAPKRLTR